MIHMIQVFSGNEITVATPGETYDTYISHYLKMDDYGYTYDTYDPGAQWQ